MNKNIIFTLLSLGCVETNLKSISDPINSSETTFEYSVSDYVVEPTESQEIQPEEPEVAIYEQVWNTPQNPKSDFLFIVDGSSSMFWDKYWIAQDFHYFVESLENNFVDWRIIFVDTKDGCHLENNILTPDLSTLDTDFRTEFLKQTNAQYMDEKLLTLANVVFEKSIDGCNKGFIREDAFLNIFMMSDEPEQSTGEVTEMIDQFIPYTNGINNLRITSVFSEIENVGRYEEAANYTNGNSFWIEDRYSWTDGSKLNQIALTGTVHEYQLDYAPIVDTIKVFINNSESNQWTYNQYTQSVVIDNNVLQPNDTIKITFEIM